MHLNTFLYEMLLKYRQFVAESPLVLLFCISLGLPADFGSVAKGDGGGYLALETHITCSSIKSCMKMKVNIVCFSLNLKIDDCAEEKDAHGLLLFLQFDPRFIPHVLLFFSSSFLFLFTTHLLHLAI